MSHMGIYSADEHFLNIFFKETTIVRRLNVHGIQLRMMIVVSIYTKYHTHRHTFSRSLNSQSMVPHLHWSVQKRTHKMARNKRNTLRMRISVCHQHDFLLWPSTNRIVHNTHTLFFSLPLIIFYAFHSLGYEQVQRASGRLLGSHI